MPETFVIIDGNSQDETLAHIHHYQERNSRAAIQHEIVCRSEPDEGLYDAMNKALRLATGDYILFLNAGDKFHSTSTLSDIAAQLTSAYALTDDETADEAAVVVDEAVAVQFLEIGAEVLDEIEEVGTLRVPRQLHAIHRRFLRHDQNPQ